jgi:hypothetical protein
MFNMDFEDAQDQESLASEWSPARDLRRRVRKLTYMSTTIDDINDAMDEAVAAQEAGDYKAALVKVESAWMRICGLPDSEFQEERLQWSRDGISKLMEWLQKKANAQAAANSDSRGSIFQTTDIIYKRA